jgi:hypothetical protein
MPTPGAALDSRPVVTPLGEDGNAFSIIARCRTAWRQANLPASDWLPIQTEMLSGSYAHLLATAVTYFNIE